MCQCRFLRSVCLPPLQHCGYALIVVILADENNIRLQNYTEGAKFQDTPFKTVSRYPISANHIIPLLLKPCLPLPIIIQEDEVITHISFLCSIHIILCTGVFLVMYSVSAASKQEIHISRALYQKNKRP